MKNNEQKSNQNQLSEKRIYRIREQGYIFQTDAEIRELAYGNRFAYRICVTLVIFGVAFANIPVLSIMMAVAFLGLVLPNHPFDYIYNLVLCKKMNKPELPPRSRQLKFACAIATLFLGLTIYMFYSGYAIWGYIIGGSLTGVAALVSTIDLCIPSKIYNALFINDPDYIKNPEAVKSNL
jgi:hypothetical protein